MQIHAGGMIEKKERQKKEGTEKEEQGRRKYVWKDGEICKRKNIGGWNKQEGNIEGI